MILFGSPENRIIQNPMVERCTPHFGIKPQFPFFSPIPPYTEQAVRNLFWDHPAGLIQKHSKPPSLVTWPHSGCWPPVLYGISHFCVLIWRLYGWKATCDSWTSEPRAWPAAHLSIPNRGEQNRKGPPKNPGGFRLASRATWILDASKPSHVFCFCFLVYDLVLPYYMRTTRWIMFLPKTK